MWREVFGCWLAWLLIACGGQARKDEPVATMTGGSGGEAGASTTLDPCGPRDLQRYCQRNRCPRTEADVVPYCAEDVKYQATVRRETSCGSVVQIRLIEPETNYYFDSAGVLMGVELPSMSCDSVYGRTCEIRSDAESVCTTECDGVPAPIDEEGVPVDPLNPFVELCFEKKSEVNAVWLGKNACGQLLYEVTYGELTRDRYCFDDAGRLIGRSRWVEGSGVTSAEGVGCEPFGYFDRVGCVNDLK